MSTPLLDSDLDGHESERSGGDPGICTASILEQLAAADVENLAYEDATPTSTAIPEGITQSHDPPADPKSRPSCRLVVTSSQVIPATSVAIIDVHGTVMVGRDRQPIPHIRLKEMMVSKHHAYIYWDDGTAAWSIVDNGSVHGTFVTFNHSMNTSTATPLTPTRLSPPRTASLPRSLQHEDHVHIGSTVFVVHMHQDSQSCDTCNTSDAGTTPLVAEDMKQKKRAPPMDAESSGPYVTQEKEDPKVAIQRLRKNLLSRSSYQPSSTKRSASSPALQVESLTYVDRAKKRRQLNVDYGLPGPETHLDTTSSSSSFGTTPLPERRYHQVVSTLRQAEVLGEPPVSSVSHPAASGPPSGMSTPTREVPLDDDNVGHRLLVRQGWREGEALGHVDEPDRSALVEPLQVRMLPPRAGLGLRR